MDLSATLSNHEHEVERLLNLRTVSILPRRASRQKASDLPKPRRHLNESEVIDLLLRYKAGETMVELGTFFGIHRRTVASHLQQHGVPSRHRTMDEEMISRCIELYQSGLSLVAVGEELGVDQATVRRALLSAGVSRRPRRGSQFGSASRSRIAAGSKA